MASEPPEIHHEKTSAQTRRQAHCQHGSIQEPAEKTYIVPVQKITHGVEVRHARNKIKHARSESHFRRRPPSEDISGRSDYRESMLAFNFNGVRVGDLAYDSHVIYDVKPKLENLPSVKGGQTLVVWLKDDLHKAKVGLFYTVFEDLPVILRHAEIMNEGDQSFVLDRAYSFCVDMPDKNWESVTLPGAHLRERFVERTKLSHGTFLVESKRGVSSGQMNPFMALVRKNTDENQGEAFGFNFVYSGDFVLKAQIEQNEELRVVGGINDYDFSWELNPDEKFTTPEIVMVYSDRGLGEMSRAFHDLYRDYLINRRFAKESRPVVQSK